MTKRSIGQKAQRHLRFLMGLRNPEALAALAKYGFTENDLREGVELLAAVTRTRLRGPAAGPEPTLIEALDAFENRWFPVARAALERRYPAVAELLFSNLAQTEGVEVAVSVGTFIERLEEMAAGSGGYGESGPAARGLLEQRGLTAERATEAKALVGSIATFVEMTDAEASSTEKQAAEDAMWAWYLEWGGIARVAIQERRLLRALGFRRGQRAADEELEDPEITPAPPALPASTPAPALPPPAEADGAGKPSAS